MQLPETPMDLHTVALIGAGLLLVTAFSLGLTYGALCVLGRVLDDHDPDW